MSIAERLRAVRDGLPPGVGLVAVSKTHPVSAIQEAYDAGQRDFGESYAQELRDKAPLLPADIRWHFIGALQKNKLKYVAPWAYRVHGLTEVDQAVGLVKRAPGPVHGMVNVNVGDEGSKVGVPEVAVPDLLDRLAEVEGFVLCGLMCIPPFTEDPADAEPWFARLAALAARERARGHALPELSMGMSHDWEHAIRHGTRWVRVGTAIFGPREG
ncbi:MAG: YggS family pyridoxal phosphate-dependent enzyme [Myxococcales bacterium]|nr:YggS family pyridoxal phosphate-dependent enzyme [Myxococcales bacterium]MCB9668490.1 YggS family pyridoxal phosphate-dependent enzyme [Alphaproteobacteria bacterium]MCB9690728.1 YggS family pyridoxal phosphate-dependent enzyme [Alphaproteobacteria bacterium]